VLGLGQERREHTRGRYEMDKGGYGQSTMGTTDEHSARTIDRHVDNTGQVGALCNVTNQHMAYDKEEANYERQHLQ